jgi:hypothetical protein
VVLRNPTTKQTGEDNDIVLIMIPPIEERASSGAVEEVQVPNGMDLAPYNFISIDGQYFCDGKPIRLNA